MVLVSFSLIGMDRMEGMMVVGCNDVVGDGGVDEGLILTTSKK
jgi:hypothetical protein